MNLLEFKNLLWICELNKKNYNMDKTFFLCSENLIKYFKTSKHSRPFKSGFENDNDNYYVALLDFNEVDTYYQEHQNNLKNEDFWCRECVPGHMNVSKITLSGMRKNGIFAEIRWKLDLTAIRNQAMTIHNLSEKFNCTPIELINKIIK